MPQRKRTVAFDNGVSRVEGYNVGRYPIHRFAFTKGLGLDVPWPLRVISVGDDDWCEGCLRTRHHSQIFAVELVVEGAFRFVQRGEHIVRPGECFLVQPSLDNTMSVAEDKYARKKVMEMAGPILPALLGVTGLTSIDVIRTPPSDAMRRQFDEAYTLMSSPSLESTRACSIIAYDILTGLGCSSARSGRPTELQEMIELMEGNVGSRLSVEELAETAGLSRTTVHRLFVEHLGESPINYFINLKIEAAKSMLAGSPFSIKEISRQLGYPSQLYFSSQFRKRTGASPSDFRHKAKFAEEADAEPSASANAPGEPPARRRK